MMWRYYVAWFLFLSSSVNSYTGTNYFPVARNGSCTYSRREIPHHSSFSKVKFYNSMEFSLNGAELSLNSVNSGNLRNYWGMNWVQYNALLCCLWLCGWVVESLSLTQEILGSNPAIFLFDFHFFLSLNSANSVKTFRENSIVHLAIHWERSLLGLVLVDNWVFHDRPFRRISVRLFDRSEITQNKINFIKKWPQWGLNSQPPDHQSCALPLC